MAARRTERPSCTAPLLAAPPALAWEKARRQLLKVCPALTALRVPLGGDTAEVALTYPWILAPTAGSVQTTGPSCCWERAEGRSGKGAAMLGRSSQARPAWKRVFGSIWQGWHCSGLLTPQQGSARYLCSPPEHQIPPNRAPYTAPRVRVGSPRCPDQCWQLGEVVDRQTDRQRAAGHPALLQSAFAQQTQALCTPNPPRCSLGGAGTGLGFAGGLGPGAWCEIMLGMVLGLGREDAVQGISTPGSPVG